MATTPDSTQPTRLMQLRYSLAAPVNSLQDILLSQCFLTDQVFSGPFELLQSIRCRNSQLSLTNPET